jgi:uncharacterized protein YprB with RNaseH-like and TPR domain
MDLQAQLDDLRKRMAAAAARADQAAAAAADARGKMPLIPIEQHMDGRIVETGFGSHFEHERLWPAHRRHGSVDIGGLAELPADFLGAISAGDVPASDVTKWAFLDTETTGLAGGSGTCAFLVGVGRITPEGFRLKQYFMRDFEDEPSLLAALASDLEDAETLITYNGKAFDVPLLETRYRMKRARPPFTWLGHLDLLFGARRLWRLRLDSCRLVDLESEILGFERDGDIPGDMIPRVYFDYLRLRSPERLKPIFEHNALDIVTLACLTAVVPRVFHDPVGEAERGARHPAEMVSLGRWLWKTERVDEALALFRQAIQANLRDDLLFRTMWDMAKMERRAGRGDVALGLWTELASCPNAHRPEACIELSKHYEHRDKDYARALEFCEIALTYEDSAELLKRRERLVKRASTPKSLRLL